MGAYPGDWHLLEQPHDPWPGDPSEVHRNATYYQGLAEDIRGQVETLRRLAEDTRELVGDFAPALRESSEELADFLERAEGRFDTVATQLGVWEPALREAQTSSRSMLREAEGHHAAAAANSPSGHVIDPTDTAAVAADQQRQARLDRANADLHEVQRRFRTLKRRIDDTAEDVGNRIKSASHDSLKNHRFDGIRKFLHDNAKWLKKLADVLTFIATIIVIAIVVLGTGGLALAVVLTAAALLIHTALAAQGDGSWVDVGLDAFALLTMGTGKLLTTGAKGLLAAREASAAYETTTSAARVAFSEASGLSKAVVFLTESNPVVRTISGLKAGLTAFRTTWTAEYAGGLAGRLMFGDKEAAGLAKAIASASERLGPGALLSGASGMMSTVSHVFHASVAVDLGFKFLNDANPFVFEWHGVKPWVEWKEEHTVHALNAP